MQAEAELHCKLYVSMCERVCVCECCEVWEVNVHLCCMQLFWRHPVQQAESNLDIITQCVRLKEKVPRRGGQCEEWKPDCQKLGSC